MNNNGITILQGDLPILISAPHAYPHKRPNLTQSYKPAEVWTDYISEQLALKTGAWAIFTTDLMNYDPNYHPFEKNEYKQAIAHIMGKHNIAYFIDLHGLSNQHPYDIGSYYAPRFTRSRKLAEDIQTILDSGKLKGLNFKTLNFLDNDQETLGEYVVKTLEVPSVQLELARYIRDDSDLRLGLIENLVEALSHLHI